MPHACQNQTLALVVNGSAPVTSRWTANRPRIRLLHSGKPAAFRCGTQRANAARTSFPVVPEQYTGDLEAAYRAGCKAGYAEGVKVTVNVSLDGDTGVSEVQQFADIQKDSLLRSLLKGVVWRVFSTALTVSIILAVFHDTVQVEQALQIGGLEFVLKLVVYFLHERLWVQIGTSIS